MEKHEIMKTNGTYNQKHAKVIAPQFHQGIFFDPHDLIQVKYEMLRSVETGESTVTQAAGQYGLSRETYYHVKSAYELGGIEALIPRKTGPKGAHKLTEKGEDFIDRYRGDHPSASVSEINNRMTETVGINVHNRTISRYLQKKHMGSR
jgi:transposase